MIYTTHHIKEPKVHIQIAVFVALIRAWQKKQKSPGFGVYDILYFMDMLSKVALVKNCLN